MNLSKAIFSSSPKNRWNQESFGQKPFQKYIKGMHTYKFQRQEALNDAFHTEIFKNTFFKESSDGFVSIYLINICL